MVDRVFDQDGNLRFIRPEKNMDLFNSGEKPERKSKSPPAQKFAPTMEPIVETVLHRKDLVSNVLVKPPLDVKPEEENEVRGGDDMKELDQETENETDNTHIDKLTTFRQRLPLIRAKIGILGMFAASCKNTNQRRFSGTGSYDSSSQGQKSATCIVNSNETNSTSGNAPLSENGFSLPISGAGDKKKSSLPSLQTGQLDIHEADPGDISCKSRNVSRAYRKISKETKLSGVEDSIKRVSSKSQSKRKNSSSQNYSDDTERKQLCDQALLKRISATLPHRLGSKVNGMVDMIIVKQKGLMLEESKQKSSRNTLSDPRWQRLYSLLMPNK